MYEKECLAIVWTIQQFRPYLVGRVFVVETDHQALKWLLEQEKPGRLASWVMQLQQYKFSIRYRPGKLNVVADALSRAPLNDVRDDETEKLYTSSNSSEMNLPEAKSSTKMTSKS